MFSVCVIQKEDPGETEIVVEKELRHISTSAQLPPVVVCLRL